MGEWHRMASTVTELQEVFLHPGELHVATEPAYVTTILGSCVSVCLWDPVLCIGGINHFVLAEWNGLGAESNRFGNVATFALAEGLAALGARRRNLQAMVFGGANVIKSLGANEKGIGSLNIAVALTTLTAQAIPILVKDVGGLKARKICFDTHAGKATVHTF